MASSNRRLILVAVVGAIAAVMGRVKLSFVRDEYVQLSEMTAWLGIDEFTHDQASTAQQAQVVAIDRLTGASKLDGRGSVELAWRPSAHVEGLRVTTRLGVSEDSIPIRGVDGPRALVVGTVRMGFGHLRIAYATCSWGLAAARTRFSAGVYFHDLLSIESAEATLIRDSDRLYRTSSKLATELGGPFEWLHGVMTSSGDATSLRSTALIAARLTPLVRDLPRGCAFVATHSLVALTVALANVTQQLVNLVIDNHPQWFVVSPRALNLVQGPRNYYGFLAKTGVVDNRLRLAGHWIPNDLVDHVAEDCARRERRRHRAAPLRVLIPIGGAGAQRAFITSLVAALAPAALAGRIKLVLNAGDHADIRDALIATLNAAGISNRGHIRDITEARALAAALRDAEDSDTLDRDASEPPVILMAFEEYFGAVTATDVLARSVDILASKPSELAFYPVPKLMIRRVGDHEAYSANRANELGDGTAEVRTVPDAVRYLNVFNSHPDPLVAMNRAIVRNAQNAVYDGCKYAVNVAFGE